MASLGTAACPISVADPAVAASASPASVSEQARARHSHGGIRRSRVEFLGTAPCNRSGLGVSGFHVHEVVASIKTDGLSRRRYRDATVVKVPAAQLDAFREFNKRMCENDDLLPAFAPDMRYALLTQQHVVHALKLLASGTHMLHGTREPI